MQSAILRTPHGSRSNDWVGNQGNLLRAKYHVRTDCHKSGWEISFGTSNPDQIS